MPPSESNADKFPSASIHQDAAGDVDRFAGNETCEIAGKEDDDVGHVLRLLDAGEGCQRYVLAAHSLRLHSPEFCLPDYLALLHGGTHEAGADTIDADALPRHLLGQRLGEADDGELAGGIVREERRADFAGE